MNLLPKNSLDRFLFSNTFSSANGMTLKKSGGPCLSEASWSTASSFTSIRFDMAKLDVRSFGSFGRNKRACPTRRRGNLGCRAETQHDYVSKGPGRFMDFPRWWKVKTRKDKKDVPPERPYKRRKDFSAT